MQEYESASHYYRLILAIKLSLLRICRVFNEKITYYFTFDIFRFGLLR